MFKKMLSFVLAAVMVLCLAACGGGYRDEYIFFELGEVPITLDPQTASTDSELLIVRNIYEGLMRRDAEGKIVGGVSESYSYENLTYIFNLREDAVWSNGYPVTAHDFVFALRRAVDPKIKAPFANRLKCIEGAESIIAGAADVSTLGVSAPDKHTIIIKLCREDKDFLETLTTSICMPCNEKFFEQSIGKYGLDAECIISNGSYRLTKWNKEDFGIRLYENEDYNGTFCTSNAAVFISFVDDEAQVARLAEGESDMAFVPCSELEKAQEAGLSTDSVQNICWVMTVSDDYSAEVRRALAMAFSVDNYSGSLPEGFEAATSLYPKALGLEDTSGVGITVYDIASAKALMSSQVAEMEDKRFPSAMLYYYNTDGVRDVATGIVGHWQQNLSTFINIEAATSLATLQAEIADRTLPFALFPISVKSDSIAEYMLNFGINYNGEQPSALQQELLSENTLFPVAFENTNISYVSTLENVITENQNGYIDFSHIIKRG